MFKKFKINHFHIISFFLLIAIFLILIDNIIRINPLNAPDEIFRSYLPFYIFENNVIPIGNETQLIHAEWGYSYAFLPYLPSLIGVFFMKIASFLGLNIHAGLRFVSVISVIGTFIMSLKIGKEIFKKDSSVLLLTVLCVFLPQIVFLGSYFNNDIFSVFMSSIIIFSWIKGIKDNWSYKICILLGIGLGCLALTYYNAYTFILCSIIIFCVSFYKENGLDWINFIKKGGSIFLVTFLISGWFFIRNAILFNGDFLGLTTSDIYSELYAIDKYKPSNRLTPENMNLSFYEAFFTRRFGLYDWFSHTTLSFIGTFRNMDLFLSKGFYAFYGIFFGSGLVLSLIPIKNLFKNFSFKKVLNNKNFNKILLGICLFLCIITPIVLSMYNSYYSDYQPQGRYIISAVLPLMIFITVGFNFLSEKINNKFKKEIPLNYILMIIYLIVFLMVYFRYFPMISSF